MSDIDQKLQEIRDRHDRDDRWRNGPSMISPQSHDDRAFLLEEIERLSARVEELERDARTPRPPEELVETLQDRIHPTSGRLLSASPLRGLKETAP